MPCALRGGAGHLENYGVEFELVPTLVRGLDYYTRTAFEFVDEAIGAQSSICGGGRYDGLIEQLGGKPTPGIGFGAGIERLLLSLEASEREARRPTRSTSSSRSTSAADKPRVLPLVQELRRARRLRADLDYAGRSLKGQLTQAGRLGAKAIVEWGPERSTCAAPGSRTRRSRRPSWRRGCGREVARPQGGELRKEHVGQRFALAGWAARRRDHGGLVFVDLRDESGLAQLVINPERAPEAAKVAHEIRNEFVLRAEGEVVARAPEAVNPSLPTGEVELQVDELEIVSRSEPLPFQLDEENVDETLRIRYRWLDLRRDEDAAQHPHARADGLDHPVARWRRPGFVDIETPILAKQTPEGARDFVVPTRLQPGRFFALPQSPQIYKQLLVISGFERYYQIARCFRDEDLRADRLQELTQLDVEMAFPDREELFALMERIDRCGSGASASASSSSRRSSA